MLDVTYVISTHPKYVMPLMTLLDSMNYIPNDRKVVVTAASDEYVAVIDGITFIFVAHNSFDFTGLIGLVEHPELQHTLTNHVFPLHDTMVLGIQSDSLIRDTEPNALATAVAGGQCNLNLLRTDYVYNSRDFLLGERNATKERAIQTEGYLYRNLPLDQQNHYPNLGIDITTGHYPYGDTARIKEYYVNVDLTKYKANYGQTNIGTFIVNP